MPKEVLNFPLSCLKTGSANTTSFACPPIEVELEVEQGGVAHAVCYWLRLYMADPSSCRETESIIAAARTEEVPYVQQDNLKSFSLNDFPFCFDTGPSNIGVGPGVYAEGGGPGVSAVGDDIKSRGPTRDTTENTDTYGSTYSQYGTNGGTYSGLPSHYRQAATLITAQMSVCEGDSVLVEVGIDLSFGVLCRVL